MNRPMLLARRYVDADRDAVRDLFVRINRQLAPPDQREAFEAYIAVSLAAEIERIPDYYAEHHGSFWIAREGDRLAGMFGLERVDDASAELRRMYVDPDHRRRGIARMMLEHAERICRDDGYAVLCLSTSELQPAALALYRNARYRLVREEVAGERSVKTVGGGIRRYHFEKDLIGPVRV